MFNRKRDYGVQPSNFDLSDVQPLKNGFAHNDAVFNNPLFDALQLGYQFIEADVHLINDEIMVYHNRPLFLNKNRTLTKCYLQPLQKIINDKDSVFLTSKQSSIYLIIDIKTDAEKTYHKLKTILQPFQSILTSWENGIEKRNPVTIILSGNRPIQKILSERQRWVCLDGRLEDIGQKYSSQVMPMISDKYSKIFGYSLFSKNSSTKNISQLKMISKLVHKEDKLFRLWGVPERKDIWRVLLKNDLDLISTDLIKKLKDFLVIHDSLEKK